MNYKKLFLLCILCSFFFSACSSAKDTNGQKPGETESNQDLITQENSSLNNTQNENKTESVTDAIQIAEQVIFNQQGITVTAKSFTLDGFFGPKLDLLIENGSDIPVSIQARNISINDIMADGVFSCDVAAGKKADNGLTFMEAELTAAGITVVKDIEFSFHISNADTWETILDSETIHISTDADPSYVQAYNTGGDLIVDQNNFKIAVLKLDTEDSFWDADLYLYIENNSGDNASVQVRDVSVNGFMADPIFSCDILAGKKAYATISFMDDIFGENDITEITEIELYFHVFETDSWDTIFDSQSITLTF